MASLAVVSVDLVSMWNSRTCAPPETPNDCTTVEAYRALWGESSSAPRAVALFADAVARDPASPELWSDLAGALLVTGDRDRAVQCSRRALALGPKLPSVLLRTVNFAAAAGCSDAAVQAAATLKQLAPGMYDDIVSAQLTRAGCSPDRTAGRDAQ